MKQTPSGVQHEPKHGLGVQVLPAAGIVPDGHPPTTNTHAPEVRQHAVSTSTGHATGPPQVPPGAGVVPLGQDEPKNVKQLPSGRQHAIMHGSGVQLDRLGKSWPLHTLGSLTREHVPSWRQHTTTHGFGEQVLPGAGVVPGGHAVEDVTKHDVTSQQANCGHGSGWQFEPGKYVPTEAGQSKIVVTMHGVPGRQHAPRQGFGVQVLPGAGIVEGGQGAPVTKKQDPSLRQQADCVWTGHGFAAHVAPKITFPPNAWHRSGLVSTHADGQQQAIVSVGPQAAFGHVPLTTNVPPAAAQFWACVSTHTKPPVVWLW